MNRSKMDREQQCIGVGKADGKNEKEVTEIPIISGTTVTHNNFIGQERITR